MFCYTVKSNYTQEDTESKTHSYDSETRMKSQKLLSLTRKAIDDYQMISEGDRIAIGISGGEDSLTLLYALSE